MKTVSYFSHLKVSVNSASILRSLLKCATILPYSSGQYMRFVYTIRRCKFSRRLRLSTTSLRRMWYSVAGVSAMFYGKTQKLRVE